MGVYAIVPVLKYAVIAIVGCGALPFAVLVIALIMRD